MQVTKLRLSGFKSFGQPTELLVEPGLTGIVGPNGCGKSNLVDALRWVMGETSARGLRGDEMDQVIFAGTAARPPFDLAEVELHLRGTASSLPELGDGDELQLSRRIGRGSGSTFRVNGKEVRARDVQLLFADAASGARSAAIVSQGRIGALVDAKPPDRRRLLEEAAGIGGLQARRHEAELKLQAAEANLLRVHDLLVTLGEQHRQLRKQARQASRYRELSAAYREVAAALLACRWRLACRELATAEQLLRDERSQIELCSERLRGARAARDQAAAEVEGLRQRDAPLAAESARLDERRRAVGDEADRLEAHRTRLRETDEQLERDLRDGQSALDEAHAARSRLEVERSGLADVEMAAHLRCEQAAAAETASTQTRDAAEAELRQALAGQAELEARLAHLKERVARSAQTRHDLAAAQQKTEQALAAFAVSAAAEAHPADATVESEVRAAAGVLQAAETALDDAGRRREATRDALERATAQRGECFDRLRTAEEAARQASQRREALEARREEMEPRRARLSGRLCELREALADRTRRRGQLELAARASAVEQAEHALGATESILSATRTRAREADSALAGAQQVEQNARSQFQQLEAESKVLAELAGPEPDGSLVIDLVDLADGAAEALAAALGDDLLGSLDHAAPTHWREGPATAAEAHDLPPGCQPLAGLVKAPAALNRRLGQVGVVDAKAADRLQGQLRQGQRLVSPDGGLWRWDGFVRRPDSGRIAAARLQQRARLLELRREGAAAQDRLIEAGRGLVAAQLAAQTVREALRAAESACEAARRDLETCRGAALEARADDAALAAEISALAQERAAIEAEQNELDRAAAALLSQLHDLAGAPPEENFARLHAALREAEAQREQAARRDREAKATHDEAQNALIEARNRLARCRAALDRQRELERDHAAKLREQELERAQLEARLARLADQRSELERDDEAAQSALQATEKDLGAARARLGAAEEAVAAARQAHAAATMEHARARDALAAAVARGSTLVSELELWTERARSAETRLAELARRRDDLARDVAALEDAPMALQRQRAELEAQLAGIARERAQLGAALAAAEAGLADAAARLDSAETERVEARESGARLEARLEHARAEHAQAQAAVRARLGQEPDALGELEELPTNAERLAGLEAELARLALLRERLGPVNLRAIDEAAELSLRIQDLEAEQAELSGAIERLRRAISTLNREGRERLRAAFAKVEEHFEALFVRLFGGGRARLSLTDMEDPLAAGLELTASPPGKKLQSVSLLSGGEKALTALALLFAVFLTRPSPLCVLDEVDAPLDDANVERLITLLEELSRATETRFVMVTHHPLTMARMHRLYGVTMAERGLSQLVSVDLDTAVELRAIA
ncbi:MAG TPA: AAA family ATPase [Geminicoccaceae bacterium]|nr:AAA family ATPase [Geminicoccaceae bacterium]